MLLAACRRPAANPPSIEFTSLPPAGPGGPRLVGSITGRVHGAAPGQRIVLYARAGLWWVQPFANSPFTDIRPDTTWTSPTHMGTEYAALLVDRSFNPAVNVSALPSVGGSVHAVAVARQGGPEAAADPVIHFGGYSWVVRRLASDRGGAANPYSPENVWTDAQGQLHLRITRGADAWICSEIALRRSLGYGSYVFVVRQPAPLDPASVLGFFTWDDEGEEENHREIDIELSQWGDPATKNAQFAIQPYYVPVNVVRFSTPPGQVTYSFRWEPGRVHFQAARGAGEASAQSVISQHVFTSGIPTPGGEAVHINLYVYGKSRIPQKNPAEVVIEKFEYLP